MSQPTPQQTLRITDPEPLGDVTLVPQQISGASEADLANSMAEALAKAAPASGSEALRILRSIFPYSSLTARVAALGTALRQ